MGKPSTERRVEGADPDEEASGFNAGDATQVGERKVGARNAQAERVAGLGSLLSSKQGRAWYWHLLSECGVFVTSFTGNSATFFNEGKRQIGLTLIGELTREFPDYYVTMMKEARNG